MRKGKKIMLGGIYLLIFFMLIAVTLEIFLRIYTKFNIAYYTAFTSPRKNSILKYPYGIIKINNFGFPDDNFSLTKTNPRIGYFGDSICYGMGAGHGFRISELLEQMFSQYEHMNFSKVSEGITWENINLILSLTEKFRLDKIIYLMNLNDISPHKMDKADTLTTKLGDTFQRFEWPRGRSYIYSYLRLIILNFLESRGRGNRGTINYEFFPRDKATIIKQTASRINYLNYKLKEIGVELFVVIIPYEMQISEEAENKYRELNVKWGEGFINRETQEILTNKLKNVKYLDAFYAFVGNEVNKSRQNNKLGEYFVYNLGDKIDWNHLNRAGHRKISEYIYKNIAVQLTKAEVKVEFNN